MKHILSKYEWMSGHAINYNKSNIFFSPNTSVESRRLVCEKLEVNEVHTFGKYLGMPMHVGKNNNEVSGFLNDRAAETSRVES